MLVSWKSIADIGGIIKIIRIATFFVSQIRSLDPEDFDGSHDAPTNGRHILYPSHRCPRTATCGLLLAGLGAGFTSVSLVYALLSHLAPTCAGNIGQGVVRSLWADWKPER